MLRVFGCQEVVSRCSMTTDGTPKRPSSSEAASPTGPAPTMRTRGLVVSSMPPLRGGAGWVSSGERGLQRFGRRSLSDVHRVRRLGGPAEEEGAFDVHN